MNPFQQAEMRLRSGMRLSPLDAFLIGANRGAYWTYQALGSALAFLFIAGALALGCGLGLVIMYTIGRVLLASVVWLFALA